MMSVEQKAYEAAGQPFNLGSPSRSARSCSTGRSCRCARKRPPGAITDEDVLAELGSIIVPKLILEPARCPSSSRPTRQAAEKACSRHRRVHTTYGHHAVTGRLASNDPNWKH